MARRTVIVDVGRGAGCDVGGRFRPAGAFGTREVMLVRTSGDQDKFR